MPKNAAIEPVDVLEEAAPTSVHGAGLAGIVAVVFVQAPAVGRHFADRVDAVAEQSPERGGAVGAGETAADADDGDRVVGGRFRRMALAARR